MEIVSSASSSSPTSTTPCVICHLHSHIYTCPRCSVRTCSVQCSSQHKKASSCSGIRDRAAYVPMNAYSWGTMMDDYVFLEDIGRIVETHGATISRGSFMAREPRGRGRGSRGRGRGRGSAAAAVVGGSKKDTLKMQLGFKNISVDFLPEGMEKRRLNQSRWDARHVLSPPAS
jgi:box C/D snoRNA protein 1